MNNLSGAARRVTRNLDQFSVICVFGSVVGCVVLPLMIQVSCNNIASLGCVRLGARGHVCIPVSLICQNYKILTVDSSHYESVCADLLWMTAALECVMLWPIYTLRIMRIIH